MAKKYRIHPAIGFARVGTSPETYLAPELSGTTANAGGTFRDATGRLKRQAVRFRVFETDDATGAVREITVGPGGAKSIAWTVDLKNKKSVWFAFAGIVGEGPAGYPAGHPLRNASITVDRDKKLIIDPLARTIVATGAALTREISKGTSPTPAAETWPGPLNGGAKTISSLGTMAVDPEGRLTVAGGLGTSGTTGAIPADGELNFDNNDGWFDDVSDGPIAATITFADDSTAIGESAWLAVAPPDYAPPIENIVTVHDLLYDLGLRFFGLDPAVFSMPAAGAQGAFVAAFQPSFTREIYPILKRALAYQWVIEDADFHAGSPRFNIPTLAAPKSAAETPATNPRFRIFRRMRNPDAPLAGGPGTMPKLNADGIDYTTPNALQFTITRYQYFALKQWSDGIFLSDWTGSPAAPDATITPSGLDRASLEAACGGSFYPGMEIGWTLRDPRVYLAPFEYRFRKLAVAGPTGLTAGDATKRMAIPWQADFLDCRDHWWPAQRPDDVFKGAVRMGWARSVATHVQLTDDWSKLGIVAPDPGDPTRFIETERTLP